MQSRNEFENADSRAEGYRCSRVVAAGSRFSLSSAVNRYLIDGHWLEIAKIEAHDANLPTIVMLQAPHVFVEDTTVSSILQARALYKDTDLPQRLRRYHANADSLFWGWNNIWLDPAFRDWNIESFLDFIQCPVLVLQGAQDEY